MKGSSMAPKPKITREMILNTVLEITRKNGFSSVNARSIAGSLKCSTRPIFTCYVNMAELKKDFLDYAFSYYSQYVSAYQVSENPLPYLLLPLSYVEFAREETNLFKFLFVKDMDLDMKETEDFYREPGNREKAEAFSDMIGVETAQGKQIFLDLFLYTHGIAVLTASGKLSLSSGRVREMIVRFLSAFVQLPPCDPVPKQ